MSQLQIHKRIDDFIKAGTANASVEFAQEFIYQNDDSKRYFFSQANEDWLKWFFDNDLFAELKNKSEDQASYRHRLPELEYLTRMVEKDPQTVTDIILTTPISKETFNPEVIDRFFWITGLLPVPQIKQILPKILEENWLVLMSRFSKSGYEYQKMVEKLTENKDFESLILLSKIIFTVRKKEEFSEKDRFSISDRLFYLGDISATGIFESLTSSDNPNKEKTLKVLLETLNVIVDLGKDNTDTVFSKTEPFYLLDVDIFTLNLETNKRSHFREDIQNLIATIKISINTLFSEHSESKIELNRIYSTYITTLPDSLTCWRLKLYAITRLPNIFKTEVKEFLFRVFNVGERYFEIDSGAEYHQGLIAGFNSLDNSDKQEYIGNVFEYYGADLDDKDKEKWRKRDGLEILTYIKPYLDSEQITKSVDIFGPFHGDGSITPHPSIGEMRSGSVSNKPPFDPSTKTIEEILVELKTNATPEKLNETYKNDDSFSPRNAEGLGDALKQDFQNRIADYFGRLSEFFDRANIAPTYLYSLLREIDEMLRNKKTLTNAQYEKVFDLFVAIKASGESEKFKRTDEKNWLPDWITVHKIMADILLICLDNIKDDELFNSRKEELFSLVKYLLSIDSSPNSEDEKTENGESAHIAINSVRGQAYRAFIQFIYNEKGTTPISQQEKDLLEDVLENDKSSAVRFTVGQFVGAFYKDKEYFKSVIEKIFPVNNEGQEKIYFATWEGYLASSLYKELFTEFKPYYEYAIKLNPNTYPDRKYLKGLDETLAVHLALAFAHFDFKITDDLFELFWNTPNETRHYEFVSFIGRSCLTRSQAGDEWLNDNNVSKQKLIEFWDWMLSRNFEPKAYSGFGFWVNPDTEVIKESDIIARFAKTLEKSGGDLDWDYGFTRKLETFANINPQNTLKCIELYLLTSEGNLNPHRGVPMFSIDNEIKDALTICYNKPETKQATIDLIDKLIEKGSNVFWSLKDILK